MLTCGILQRYKARSLPRRVGAEEHRNARLVAAHSDRRDFGLNLALTFACIPVTADYTLPGLV
jgi:hypothetical protein